MQHIIDEMKVFGAAPLQRKPTTCVACHKKSSDDSFLPRCYHSLCTSCIKGLSKKKNNDPYLTTTWLNCPKCGVETLTSAKYIGDNERDHWKKVEQLCKKVPKQGPFLAMCGHFPYFQMTDPSQLKKCKHCPQLFCNHCYEFHLNLIYLETILIAASISLEMFKFCTIDIVCFQFRERAIACQFASLVAIRKAIQKKSGQLKVEMRKYVEDLFNGGEPMDDSDDHWQDALAGLFNSDNRVFWKLYFVAVTKVKIFIRALKWLDRLEHKTVKEVVKTGFPEILELDRQVCYPDMDGFLKDSILFFFTALSLRIV